MNAVDLISKSIMGNIVGIIYYDPVSHDNFGQLICDIRIMHRLDMASPEVMESKQKKRYDGVELGGYWIALYGYDTCKKMILAFLRECETRLERAGATGIETKLKEINI